jgi:hypothetical protein
MRKLLSILVSCLLVLGLVQTALAVDGHECNMQSVVGSSEKLDDITDSSNIPGYLEVNKGEMRGGSELSGTNPYITITQVSDSGEAVVHYYKAYVVDNENWELKYFYYKAAHENIYKVTFETPLKVGECAKFNLGFATNPSGHVFQPDISHFVTVAAGFELPAPPVIEYKEETAWAWGTYSFNDLVGANKWGWYLDAKIGTFDVYAAAGRNDINKGVLIGTVQVSIDEVSNRYVATFIPIGNHKVTKMHFGVYETERALKATGGAPGQFTNNVSVSKAKFMAIHFEALVAR